MSSWKRCSNGENARTVLVTTANANSKDMAVVVAVNPVRFSSALFVDLRSSSAFFNGSIWLIPQPGLIYPEISILGLGGDCSTRENWVLCFNRSYCATQALLMQCSELEGTANYQYIAFSSNRMPPPSMSSQTGPIQYITTVEGHIPKTPAKALTRSA